MPETAKGHEWGVHEDVIHEIDSAIEEHAATIRTLGALFVARMDMERGLTYEQLCDVDVTLRASTDRLKDRCFSWFGKRRRALGISEDPAARGPRAVR